MLYKRKFWKLKALVVLLLLLSIFGVDKYIDRSQWERERIMNYKLINNCHPTDDDSPANKTWLCDTGRWSTLELTRNALDVPDDRKE